MIMIARKFGQFSACLGAALLVSIGAGTVQAVPYASGIEDHGVTASFVLNQDADNVTVILGGGAETKELGALEKGRHIFERGTHGSFEIVVRHQAPEEWTEISDEDNPLLHFFTLRGVAVNRNPASPYFGRIYVANSIANSNPRTGRAVEPGIYLLNADQSDALGQGDQARTGGLDFFTGSDWSPYRISVGDDDNLYIPDFSRETGNLYVTDPDVSEESGEFVLKPLVGSAELPVGQGNNHGAINRVFVTGSLAEGNLVVYSVDEVLQEDRQTQAPTQLNSLWRYEIGDGPLPYEGDPIRMFTPGVVPNSGFSHIPQTMDMDRGRNGFFYITDFRLPGTDTSGLIVTDAEGNHLWNSRQTTLDTIATSADLLYGAQGVAVSPDQSHVAVMRFDGLIWLLPLVDGIPDIERAENFEAFPLTGAPSLRAVTYDAAGNLYVVRSAADDNRRLAIFSPGGETMATTRSDGTFSLGPTAVEGVPPEITKVEIVDGEVWIDFTASATDSPASFRLVSAATVTGPYTVEGGATIESLGGGLFRAKTTPSAGMRFYQIQRIASDVVNGDAPEITRIGIDNGEVRVDFTAAAADTPGSFTLMTAPAVGGPYTADTGAQVESLGGGLFRATTAVSGSMRFYRIRR